MHDPYRKANYARPARRNDDSDHDSGDDDWDDDWDEEGWDADWDDQTGDHCPHCDLPILDDTPRCPHCGDYIIADTRPWSNKPGWLSNLGILLLVMVLITFILSFVLPLLRVFQDGQ